MIGGPGGFPGCSTQLVPGRGAGHSGRYWPVTIAGQRVLPPRQHAGRLKLSLHEKDLPFLVRELRTQPVHGVGAVTHFGPPVRTTGLPSSVICWRSSTAGIPSRTPSVTAVDSKRSGCLLPGRADPAQPAGGRQTGLADHVPPEETWLSGDAGRPGYPGYPGPMRRSSGDSRPASLLHGHAPRRRSVSPADSSMTA